MKEKVSDKNMNWALKGQTVFYTLFMVFCALSIVESIAHMRLIKLDIDTIAPQNLPRLAEMFELSLKVESPDFPIEEMTESESWSTLQDKLTGYAQRLEMMENYSLTRLKWTSYCTLASVIGMLGCGILDMKHKKAARNKEKS